MKSSEYTSTSRERESLKMRCQCHWKPALLALLILICIGLTDGAAQSGKAEPSYEYPTQARWSRLNNQIYNSLTFEQARRGVPEIKLLSNKQQEIEYIGDKKDLVDLKLWQESPSRIIFHNGKYHTWIMHITYYKEVGRIEEARNYYLTSDDGTRWKVETELLPGEPGSFDDFWREGLQVVAFEGKFWMFYAANATDDVKYGNDKRNGYRMNGIGLLVADQPEGPWKRATDKPLFVRSEDPNAWDYDMTNNPYPVYFKGKWFIYYKSKNTQKGITRTLQGVAVADAITGPYVKYENNPICDGHGSFVWAWRGGITMLPFGAKGKIHWSPDGLHWHNVDDPASRRINTPIYSAFYLPHDPLSGTPVTREEPDQFWGLETRQSKNANPRDWSIVRGTATFNPPVKRKRK
jgi:hypothetical protein